MDAALFVSVCRRGPSMEEAAVNADVTVPFTACTIEPPDQPTISNTSDGTRGSRGDTDCRCYARTDCCECKWNS